MINFSLSLDFKEPQNGGNVHPQPRSKKKNKNASKRSKETQYRWQKTTQIKTGNNNNNALWLDSLALKIPNNSPHLPCIS